MSGAHAVAYWVLATSSWPQVGVTDFQDFVGMRAPLRPLATVLPPRQLTITPNPARQPIRSELALSRGFARFALVQLGRRSSSC